MVRPTSAAVVDAPNASAPARRWVRSSQALRLLRVKRKTLLSWARMGSIPTRVLPSRTRDPDDPRQRRVHRLFDVGALVHDDSPPPLSTDAHGGRSATDGAAPPVNEPCDAIYARVSTAAQTPRLERQIAHLSARHPDAKVYRDVASGLNLQRDGLQTLLTDALAGRIRRVFVIDRERIARFGVELVEFVLRRGGATLVLDPPPPGDNHVDASAALTDPAELADDVLAVVAMLGARLHAGGAVPAPLEPCARGCALPLIRRFLGRRRRTTNESERPPPPADGQVQPRATDHATSTILTE